MTELITDYIKNDKPFVFLKLGDGEYNACHKMNGTNCDGDPYTDKLQTGIIQTIQYFSLQDSVFFGKWHMNHISAYFDSIAKKQLNWIDYHTFIMNPTTFDNDHKLQLIKSIKESKRPKILISNELLVKANYLLNVDTHIKVPYRNWVDNHFQEILNTVIESLQNIDNPLIITCAGMGSKILVMEIYKRFPNGMFIDIGSGLDYLCTKKCSRGWSYSYNTLETYFEDILPPNWNDPQFEPIYKLAQDNIGIHLPK